MERVEERLNQAVKAVAALSEVVVIDQASAIWRDSAIKRFELAFEATWKAAKSVLLVREGIEVSSPKGVIRSCREVGCLSDALATEALLMADDRNLAVHTYNEELAEQIYGRLKSHLTVLRAWVASLSVGDNEKQTGG